MTQRATNKLPPNMPTGSSVAKPSPELSSDIVASPSLARTTARAAERLTLEGLLANYNPGELLSAVTIELQRRLESSKQNPSNPKVIVFGANGSVDSETSLRLIEDYLLGDGHEEFVTTANGGKKTYRVGELPEQTVGVNPISGRDLKRSGVDKDDGLNWSQCDLQCRQLLALAVQTGELLPTSVDQRDRVFYHQTASNTTSGLATLISLFPRAAEEFYNRALVDDLPRLKRIKGSATKPDTTCPVEIIRRRN
jgi:hypothetical protein